MSQPTLIESALQQLVAGLEQSLEKIEEKPSNWIQKNFYVPDPRDPITGEFMHKPGPIILAQHQCDIIDEALSRDKNGLLNYSTIVYSAPKKSGKSAVTSAVITYVAHHNPYSYLYCLANDGKQANDRLYGPISRSYELQHKYNGPLRDETPRLGSITLSNGTVIEALPVDAAGEAGSQPLMTAWSELWGYETPNKRKMWVEMTIPPTLYGRALRWVETYAGYTGTSELLENLYKVGFLEGEPHPAFAHLNGSDGPVVRVNKRAGMFVYWDTEHRMPWQTKAYYTEQAQTMASTEFDRIHNNVWVSSLDSFVREEWWDGCENLGLPLLESKTVPAVVGIDMAETGDCAALVLVTRDPFNPKTKVAVRAIRIFNPKRLGGIIDQEKDVRPVIEEWAERFNIVCWVYDPREMSKLAQDLTRAGLGWFKKFGQTTPRAEADKALYDMVISKHLVWCRHTTEGDIGYKGDASFDTLRKHITLAGANISNESRRLVKLSNNNKIDAAVALSMAAQVCRELAIDNNEFSPDSLLSQYQKGQITEQEFSDRIRAANPSLLERLAHDYHRNR